MRSAVLLAFVFFYLIYIVFVPVALIVVTPFVLLWPGRKREDGSREPKPVRQRYERIWNVLKAIGAGSLTPSSINNYIDKTKS